MKQRLYSIGHSNRSVHELLAMLNGAGVERLIDVRRFPASRSQPQFNGPSLRSELEKHGIAYSHLEALGGRRAQSRGVERAMNAGWEHAAFHNYADYARSSEFQAAFRQLLTLARQEVCAMMCAEALWWRCHRRILADYAMAHGFSVIHLFTSTKSQPAALTPFARVEADLRLSYPSPDSASGRRAPEPQRPPPQVKRNTSHERGVVASG